MRRAQFLEPVAERGSLLDRSLISAKHVRAPDDAEQFAVIGPIDNRQAPHLADRHPPQRGADRLIWIADRQTVDRRDVSDRSPFQRLLQHGFSQIAD